MDQQDPQSEAPPAVVVVVGQFRSGGSAVAEVLHTLGVPVAVTMHAPAPPVYRCEWEDVELSTALSRWALGEWQPENGWTAWLSAYLAVRRSRARETFGDERIGLKSPLLALVWDELMEAAGGTPGCVRVIRTSRPASDVNRSALRAFPAAVREVGMDLNVRVRSAMELIECDLVVHYPTLVDEPGPVVRAIARLAQVADPERIDDAISRVGGPTS